MFQRGGHYADLDRKLSGYAKRPKVPVYALSLDGISAYLNINVAANLDNLTQNISIVLGFRLLSWTNTASLTYRGFNWRLYEDATNNRLTGIIIDASDNSIYTTMSVGSIILNTRYNIAMTADTTNNLVKGFLNGVETSSEAILNDIKTTAGLSLLIGLGAAYVHGYIYNIAIYNTVLTPTQVANLSNGSVKPNDISGCALYHDYTLGHAQDLSGNGNHGTLIGNAQFIIDYYLPR